MSDPSSEQVERRTRRRDNQPALSLLVAALEVYKKKAKDSSDIEELRSLALSLIDELKRFILTRNKTLEEMAFEIKMNFLTQDKQFEEEKLREIVADYYGWDRRSFVVGLILERLKELDEKRKED